MAKTCKELRDEFVKFFEARGHRSVPSSSLLPADDPTLLFANAGMNQFKPIFLGTETRDYTRAVNSQKCIRAGGKHNDLEDVGRDCYHHTFFEMLGNWSFGDYFKAEAIDWAWELLTEVWHLPAERLYATYFEGDEKDGLAPDDEARELWLKYLPADHVLPGNKKDNFWEMGETGPCGPCSEIHIDITPDGSGAKLINADSPLAIELWNLVFIQFNRLGDSSLEPLPSKHVDTGLGLERVAKVLQGKRSNYATDLFVPIIEAVEKMTDHRYGSIPKSEIKNPKSYDRFDAMDEENLGDVAMRVIVDHARCLTFAIADGILPSNDGRGSVLRSVLRRAAGVGRQDLHIEGTFLHKLVPVIVEIMGDAFGEISQRQDYVTSIIKDEEEAFAKTLDRGLALFEKELITGAKESIYKKFPAAYPHGPIHPKTGSPFIAFNMPEKQPVQTVPLDDISNGLSRIGCEVPEISGKSAFELHATYGFPFTLTKLMAEKHGFKVDETSYKELMEEHRATSSAGDSKKFKALQVVGLPATDDSFKYCDKPTEAKVLGWVADGKFVEAGELNEGDEAAVVLDRTNFYGEAGGQVGDVGELVGPVGAFDVSDTQVMGQCVLHVGRVRMGKMSPGQTITTYLCCRRVDTVRNHTATHLLNWALGQVLGEGVDQAGSVVDGLRLRFDFTHNSAVTAEQLAQVEKLVNMRAGADEPIVAKVLPLDDAKKIPGVRAVFGEKYPDPVRVVAMGTTDPQTGSDPAVNNVEFCGGVHLERTGQVGLFKIVAEESVAKGVRRITAVTGPAAVEWVQQADATLREAGSLLKVPAGDIPKRIAAMQAEIKKLRKKPAAAAGPAGLSDEITLETPAGKVLVARSATADAGAMRNICDQQRQKGAAAVFLGGADEEDGKVLLIAMVSDELVKASGFKAGDWVKQIAPIVEGGGGGKPSLAQAGGKNLEKLPEALKAAADWAKEKLG